MRYYAIEAVFLSVMLCVCKMTHESRTHLRMSTKHDRHGQRVTLQKWLILLFI